MLNPRSRSIIFALTTLLAIWAAAVIGYKIAQNATVTPEKVRAYVESVKFDYLSATARAAAIQKLAAMLNALTLEERQSLRLNRLAWFNQMSEAEKATFLEATLPTGFKQMLAAFEDMPPDKRKSVVDRAIRQMKKANERLADSGQAEPDANRVALSPELQEQVTKIGLKSFYSQSSAQTKAEMAPLLEEMQHAMESGKMTR
jgi:hypothetical protein